MLEAYGNIWDLAPDYNVIVITTNGFVKKNGEAVMGRGVALEAKTRYPDLPRRLGAWITKRGNHVGPFYYPLDKLMIMTFPVKPIIGPNGEPGWRAKADLALIEQSAKELVGQLGTFKERVLIPRPGCGNGGLKWEDVKPVIEPLLDDRFTVVTFHE